MKGKKQTTEDKIIIFPGRLTSQNTAARHDRDLLKVWPPDCGIRPRWRKARSLRGHSAPEALGGSDGNGWSRILRRHSGIHAALLPGFPGRADFRDDVSDFNTGGAGRISALRQRPCEFMKSSASAHSYLHPAGKTPGKRVHQAVERRPLRQDFHHHLRFGRAFHIHFSEVTFT